MSRPISDYTVGHDNNFNLIRFVAATLVLFAHSFPLSLGREITDPISNLMGIGIGELAVDIFFITSGFLVTQSLINRPCLRAFFWARILRIFPALFVAMIFCVFVVGLYFTTLPVAEFITHNETLTYLKKNLTLIWGDRYFLPGVFEENIYPAAVNGSIWTLPWELKMYILLGLTALIGRNKKWLLISTLALLGTLGYIIDHLVLWGGIETDPNKPRFISFFFMGSIFYLFKEKIKLSPTLFYSILALWFISILSNQESLLFIIYTLTLAYLVLYLAYIPKGAIRNFNQLGDYSYGVYIYAFPIQQSIAAIFIGIGAWSMFFLALPITLVFAILSWHVIEKPCLKLKKRANAKS